MGYLSCRADSSAATCRSITAISPLPISRRGSTSSRRHHPALTPTPAAAERFAYADLEAATSGFADAALLGRGSHGAVYKAVLPSGRAVAVKRPSPRRPEVDNEIRILSSLRGPRIVNLLGFSDPGPDHPHPRHRLLVVEYMPNGTLYDLLHSSPRPPSWPRRLRLALQTARALRGLHDADPPVVHRDVKSANVLLDANLDARLGDFGLALRLPKQRLPGDASPAPAPSPAPAGTLGYLDPAYVTPDTVSTKTDVFSFGILLLEIMSGRKAIDVQHSPPSVVEWAVPLLRRGKVASLFDPRVPPPRDPATRKDLAVLAASCVRSSRDRRPSMAEVVERLVVLTKAVSAKVWNGLADGLAAVGNPCAVVDVQKTISKRAAAAASSRRAESERESTSALTFDDDEKEEADAEASEDQEVPLVGARKPPRPLKGGIVLAEAGARERRNLLELMARIDGVAGQRFGISRARTVRATSELIDKDAVLLLRRNQTVRVVGAEVLPKSERFAHFDVKIKHKAGKEQEKADKAAEVQEKSEKIQENASRIQERSEIPGKTDKLVEDTKHNLSKEEGVREKTGQNLETTEIVQENEGKIQGIAEKVQESAGKVQDKVDTIHLKSD